jgi:hypothetical protein
VGNYQPDFSREVVENLPVEVTMRGLVRCRGAEKYLDRQCGAEKYLGSLVVLPSGEAAACAGAKHHAGTKQPPSLASAAMVFFAHYRDSPRLASVLPLPWLQNHQHLEATHEAPSDHSATTPRDPPVAPSANPARENSGQAWFASAKGADPLVPIALPMQPLWLPMPTHLSPNPPAGDRLGHMPKAEWRPPTLHREVRTKKADWCPLGRKSHLFG